MEQPTVECPYCWDVFSWDEVPEHLSNEHDGTIDIELIGVTGKPPMVAVGESSGDHIRISQITRKG